MLLHLRSVNTSIESCTRHVTKESRTYKVGPSLHVRCVTETHVETHIDPYVSSSGMGAAK